MYCYYHPDKPSVAQCVICGKNLCSECITVKDGQNYCRDCLQMGEISVDTGKIFVPALACGVLAGLLSIAPVIGSLNCVFCLWIVLGGGLAVYLLKRLNNIKGKISTGKAALTGGLTGFIASLISSAYLFLSTEEFDYALNEAMRSPDVQEALREAGIEAGEITGIILVGVAIVYMILFSIFGGLGGVISNEFTKK